LVEHLPVVQPTSLHRINHKVKEFPLAVTQFLAHNLLKEICRCLWVDKWVVATKRVWLVLVLLVVQVKCSSQ
jgi:hypothetical protein